MKKVVLILALYTAVPNPAYSQEDPIHSAEFDKVVAAEFPLGQTGATILVSSRGKVIYKKAFGTANLELNVPMEADNVFRIASITKQFTAIAILQLLEQGKLSLHDEIIRFIPDYPVQGTKITIEHLLTHTSGIRDYASIPDTTQRGRLDFSPVEMINYFKNQPMRFVPGTRYEYSNSNYFLLGFIIEKITGGTYQDFLKVNFFKPLGMSNSHYGSDTEIIKKRAAGYTYREDRLINAEAISMTQPYAAGSILSTVEDLFKWNQAVQTYKLVKKETLEKAYKRYVLSNGKEIDYGYGFRFGFIQESPSIWHGGLINGFATMAMYLPEEDVYVAVLSNCNCLSPERITAMLAAIAIGKPYRYEEIAVAEFILQDYAGVYENENGDQVLISVSDNKLNFQRGNSPRAIVRAFKSNEFYFEDPMITLEFNVNQNKMTDRLTVRSRRGNEIWHKTDKTELSLTEIKVDDAILELYTGEYEVSPQFRFTIIKEDGRLFVQADGQEKLEMFADAYNKFFLKINDARFEFVMESGKVKKVVLRQSGRTTEAIKIR